MSEGKNDVQEIPDDVSQRICQHMNDDHALSVYVMAKEMVQLESGWKLSDARLKKVTLAGCTIQAITCHQDTCAPQMVVYPFQPPLKAVSEARSRLVKIHQRLTSPQLQWIITKPAVLITGPLWLFLIWATQIATPQEFTKVAKRLPYLHLISASDKKQLVVLSQFLGVVFALTFVGHVIETVFVIDKAKNLKLSKFATASWMVFVFLAGYPIFSEIFELYKVYEKQRKEAKVKKA